MDEDGDGTSLSVWIFLRGTEIVIPTGLDITCVKHVSRWEVVCCDFIQRARGDGEILTLGRVPLGGFSCLDLKA